MILDLQTVFSGSTTAAGVTTGQALTATAISDNVVDLRNAATPALADEGTNPDEEWLIVQVVTAAAGGDAAKTLTITLESDSTANLATAPVVHYTSTAITGATLVAGYVAVRIPLPSGDYKRFLGLRYTVSAGFTSFQIRAFMTPDPQRNVIYPVGFAVT
jgi:hypothetical protein